MHKKQLTISILMSGRQETTKKCLDSLKPLRTRLNSELILVDTGCDAKTRRIIEDYADQIIDFPWCNDFAKARNAGLEKADGEWFLFLDDDEWFENAVPVAEFLRSEEAKEYDQAVYKVRNYSNMQGTKYTDEWVSRITRIEPDTRFVGKVHEFTVPMRGKCKKIDAFVHHYGYAYADDKSREEHLKRNEPLLKEMIHDEPQNVKWRTQLVQEYASVKRTKELRETAEDALRYFADDSHPYINQCRGSFFNAMIIADFLEEKYEDALKKAELYAKDSRNTAMCQLSLYNYGVECAVHMGDYKAVERCSEKYMEQYKDLEAHPIQDEQQRIIAESITFVKDAAAPELYDKNLMHWAVSMIRQEKPDEIGADKKEELTRIIQKMLEDNGDFFRMPEQVWEIGRARIVDLEEMLLGLEMSQWIVAASVLMSQTTPDELKKIEKQLKGVQIRENIRYNYYRMRSADIQILTEEHTQDYAGIRNHFRAFASRMLQFYEQIYLPDAFEGEMEMLPEHCSAAVWIKRMLDCEDTDWEGMLRCLRKCAKAYPELGEQVKQLAELIGKEQERLAAEAQEAEDELQDMVSQVKPKVLMMLEGGMAAEAYQVVQQLRQMMPENPQVQQMEVLVQSKLM